MIVDYARCLIVTCAVVYYASDATEIDRPLRDAIFLACLLVSFILDLVDGYLARRMGLESRLGAILDVGLDLVSHSLLWYASEWPLAGLLIGLEWLAGILVVRFIVIENEAWKSRLADHYWRFVRVYFRNGQKNLVSGYSNVAHFCLPAALFLGYSDGWLMVLTVPGVILYEAVTAVMIHSMYSDSVPRA